MNEMENDLKAGSSEISEQRITAELRPDRVFVFLIFQVLKYDCDSQVVAEAGND